MDEREKRIALMSANIKEAICLIIRDEENPNFLGESINKFEFMVALNFSITNIYNALEVEGGNLDMLGANYANNRAIVQYLMKYGKMEEK